MKALIVDDEKPVRKSIRLIVDWETHGICQVDEATNGLEAMQMIQQEQPQIVLMDIHMPLKNGLDLMEWLHTTVPDTKFIVISGHNDFEFMRNTIWYSGIDYILKPIDEKMVNIAVQKAVAAWKEEQQERTLLLSKDVSVNEYRPVYSEKLLTSLITDPRSQPQALPRLRDLGVLPEQITAFRPVLLQMDNSDQALSAKFGQEKELLTFTLLNICNELLHERAVGLAFKHWGTQHIIVLLLWRHPEAYTSLLQEINQAFAQILQRNMHFGVGPTIHDYAELPAAYEAGMRALRSRNLLLLGQHIHTAPVSYTAVNDEGQEPVRFGEVEEHWKTALLSGQSDIIEQAVSKWMVRLQQNGQITPRHLEQWNRDIERFQTRIAYDTIGSAAGELLVSIPMENAPNPDKDIFSLTDWKSYWQQSLSRLSASLLSTQTSGQHLMNDVISYMQQNYNQDLSLYDIAKRFFVSREYISRKFKQTYGTNMSDYLTKIRIDHAKQLLRNPQMKLAVIAEKVGFKNEKYFSQVFKKQEGISPGEFRKQHRS